MNIAKNLPKMQKITSHTYELPKEETYKDDLYTIEPSLHEESFFYGGEGYGASSTDYLCDSTHFGDPQYTNGYTFGYHSNICNNSPNSKSDSGEPTSSYPFNELRVSSDPVNVLSHSSNGSVLSDSSSVPSEAFSLTRYDDSPNSQDGQDKGQERKGKRFTKQVDTSRFQVLNNSHIDIHISDDTTSTTCLGCNINYEGYSGTITNIDYMNPYLINRFSLSTFNIPKATVIYPIQGDISSMLCLHQRTRYDRDIWELHGTVSNIAYKTSSAYSAEVPYEPQYYRFELDSQGQRINMSKSGMCPYCPQVRFLPFKNLSYLSHLTLEHGIFSNNFLTPEGLAHGQYRINKSSKNTSKSTKEGKERLVDGIVCPHCHDVIEVGCWSLKHNKLLNYFRHFKIVHGDDTTNSMLAVGQITPVKARGRKLRILD